MRFIVLSLILMSAYAYAQAQTPAAAPAPAEEARQLGWKKSANLGTNISFSSSQDVVGQTDGTSETYGLNLNATFNRLREMSEWRTDMNLVETTTRTPNIDRFVKSADELKIGTAYLYYWNGNPKFGPYANAEATAPVFAGENVQSEPKTYRYVFQNGTTSAPFTASSARLTDGFRPLTTKESLGVFWRPRNTERLKIETRIGAAALQIAAGDQFSVRGTNAAGEIEIAELEDVSQAGIEAGILVKGKIDDKSAYEVGAEFLTPLVTNQDDADDRDALRLTNVDAHVKLTSNITSWASFGYDYKLKIQPQLVDRAQQIHMLVLSANYNLF